MDNKKRLVTLVAILAVVVSVIAIPIIGNESDHETLTIESLEVRILNENIAIQKAEKDVSVAKSTRDNAIADKALSGSSVIETQKNRDYYPKSGEMNFVYAEYTLENTIESEVLTGQEKYFDYHLLMDEIVIQQNQVSRLEKSLASVNTKIDLGTATINDRTSAELEVQKSSYTLMTLNNDRDRLFLDLNLMLNYELDQTLVLTELEIPFEQYSLEDIEDHIEYVLVTNGDLVKLQEQLELAEIELEIYKDYNGSGAYDSNIRTVNSSIKDLEYDIADKKLNLEYDVRSKYNGLLNSYDSFVIKDLELENLQLTLDVTSKRFDVGLETQSSVGLAQENLDFAELAYEQAKLDYYVAVESYKNFID